MTASISKLLHSWLFIDLSEHHYTALTSKFNNFFNRSSTMLNNVFKWGDLEFISSPFFLLSVPWVRVNRWKSKRWKSHRIDFILHKRLVWMYPRRICWASQAKGYTYVCKQLLLIGVCNAFLWRSLCLEALASLLCIRPIISEVTSVSGYS